MRRLSLILLLVSTGVIAGCAARHTASGETSSKARRDPTIIDSTELHGGNFSNVYDAVSRLHADWLLPRGGPQANRSPELGIWIEGQLRTRPVVFLRELRPTDIKQVRRLSPTESLHTYSWPWGGLVLTPR